MLERAGANRILALDLHAAPIQGFFDIPVDHLFATPVMIEYWTEVDLPDLTVVSPDAGGVERARAFAKRAALRRQLDQARQNDLGMVEWQCRFTRET